MRENFTNTQLYIYSTVVILCAFVDGTRRTLSGKTQNGPFSELAPSKGGGGTRRTLSGKTQIRVAVKLQSMIALI